VDHAGCATVGTASVLHRLLSMPGLLTEHPWSVATLGGSQVQTCGAWEEEPGSPMPKYAISSGGEIGKGIDH
jgi:hypothetical protein